MAIVRKMLTSLLLLIGSVLILLGLTFYNLKHNSVYYARHMHHQKGTEPDLVMLLENMGWLYMPEIEGVTYDNDGKYSIFNDDTGSLFTTTGNDFMYSKNKVIYVFNRKFHMYDISNFSDPKIIPNQNEQEIKQELRHMLQPVLDAQTKPLVNLQWLFNYLYQNRFD